MSFDEVKNSNAGMYLPDMWVVCKKENKDVIAVMVNKQSAEELSNMIHWSNVTYYKVPSFDSLVESLTSD